MRIDDTSVLEYVRKNRLLPDASELEVEPAGDGNINWVRRVRVPGGPSIVIKHARSTLERFPEYAAPPERLRFEYAYGEVVRSLVEEEANVLPRVLHFDPEAFVLVLEDLGDAPRLEEPLLAGDAPEAALERLGRFLGRVHAATRGRAEELAPRFGNGEMQRLHGEHIFRLPFEPPGFPVSPDVRVEADRLLGREGVRNRIEALRERYYGSREALVHADVQPTNVLLTAAGPKLLDAEISHVGDPAFDVGSLLGHLRIHRAIRPEATALERAERAFLWGYSEGGGTEGDASRAWGYAAVEMLRRTIGAARVRAVQEPSAAVAVVRQAETLLG